MKNKTNLILIAIAIGLLTSCAYNDPFLAYVESAKAQIAQMPENTPQQRAAKYNAYSVLSQQITEERRTRALEQMAMPQPTPWVNQVPTPIQVQIVPNPYGY